MPINDVSQVPGFNQQRYDSLIEQARNEQVPPDLVDELLLGAVNRGRSFDQALDIFSARIPKLKEPNGEAFARMSSFWGAPSPGALIMGTVIETASERRRQEQEQIWKETEAVVKAKDDQAKELRNMARTQLIAGIVCASVSVGIGVAQVGISAAGVGRAAKAGAEAADKARTGVIDKGTRFGEKAVSGLKAERLLLKADIAASKASSATSNQVMFTYNTTAGAVGQIGGGFSKAVESTGQYFTTIHQAEIKKYEKEEALHESIKKSVERLEESYREVKNKALSSMEELQRSTNETRRKIFA
ncbi:MAG: hypothetical protein LBD82_02280 [Deltaproteobacteria bacterium]|jgi:hypothetical protein|nr:hypothetical protein [Deltaproteobacteria bacterium]